MFHGKIHCFGWAIFNSKLLKYQRVQGYDFRIAVVYADVQSTIGDD